MGSVVFTIAVLLVAIYIARVVVIFFMNAYQSVDRRVGVYVKKVVDQAVKDLSSGDVLRRGNAIGLVIYKEPEYLGYYLQVMLKRSSLLLYPHSVEDVQYIVESNLEELGRGLFYGTYMVTVTGGCNVPVAVKFWFRNYGIWKIPSGSELHTPF